MQVQMVYRFFQSHDWVYQCAVRVESNVHRSEKPMTVQGALRNTGNYVLVNHGCSPSRVSGFADTYSAGVVAVRQSYIYLGHKEGI